MNVLFVYSKNKWRSPTAERLYKNYPNLNVCSASISSSAHKVIKANDIDWANTIFMVENKHKRYINQQFRNQLTHKSLIVLDIADNYHYMDDELVAWLTAAIDAHLGL